MRRSGEAPSSVFQPDRTPYIIELTRQRQMRKRLMPFVTFLVLAVGVLGSFIRTILASHLCESGRQNEGSLEF